MLQSRAARMVEFLLGCALVVGSVVFLRLRQVNVGSIVPTISSSEAAQIYKQRIQATDILLQQDRLEQEGL